jgi:hypothetical protein
MRVFWGEGMQICMAGMLKKFVCFTRNASKMLSQSIETAKQEKLIWLSPP